MVPRVLSVGLLVIGMGHCGSACAPTEDAAQEPTARATRPSQPAMRSERPSRPATAPGNIVIDGDPSEWPDGEAFLADADYLYFRVRSQAGPEGPQPIQASPESLVLLLDTDGRDRTGATVQDPPDASGLGVDLEIHFSPAAGVSEHRNGVAIYTNTSEGRTPVTNGEIGLLASPTFAATEHEGRIARFMPGLGLPEAGLRSSGRVRGMFILRDREGEIAGWSDPFDVDVPQARGARALSTATIPERPGNALRVMSYNVLFASPVRNSGPFAGVINAIDPDVILFQEWTAEDAGSVRGWLGAMVPGEPAWNVMTGAGWGVALASRFPMRPFGPTNLPGPSRNDDGSQRAVNFLGAIIESPVGPVAVVTVHLKCCGGSTGPEEDTRRAEARRINDALVLALEQNPDVVGLVVGGDMNLVGSRLPIDIIGSGLDADGSSLEAAYTRVLGDDAVYTWYESDNRFPPGRLDWLLYGEAYSEAINAFALDTQRLADGPLAQSGLYRDDSRASDHLPLVVDVRPRGN